jgi:LmbE family N-acetylglucosaminyl deacetylase
MSSAPCAESRVFLIAPHSDDVAWSIAGLGAHLAASRPCTLVTVFSRSAYGRVPGPPSRARVTRARLREDRAFCAAAGLSFAFGRLDDALGRGYPDLPSLFRAQEARTDPAFQRVVERLGALVPDRPEVVVLAPVGIGRHVDHVLCREAARRAFRRSTVLFYEDLPYLWWLDEAGVVRAVRRRLGSRFRPYLHAVARPEWKRAAAALYPSQPCGTWLELFDAYGLRARDGRHVERVWCEDRSAPSRLPPGSLSDARDLALAPRPVCEAS